MAQGFRRPYSIYSIYAKSKQSTLSQGKLSTGKDQTDMTLPACLPFLFLKSRNRDRHLHQVLVNVTEKIRDCDRLSSLQVTIPNLSQLRRRQARSFCTQTVGPSQKVQHRAFCDGLLGGGRESDCRHTDYRIGEWSDGRTADGRDGSIVQSVSVRTVGAVVLR